MAALLTNTLEQVGQLHKSDDDLIDRLNHRFTVILLVTFTAFVSGKQFVGDPISCWAPAEFTGSQVAYTNSICWLKGTYYLGTDKQSIPHHTQNSEFRIAYYQFVPYMLLVMAILFYLPHMLWRNISGFIGFDLRKLIQNIKAVLKADINQIASQIHTALQDNSSKHIFCRLNHRLTLLYLFVKILYIINCFCQFYFLSNFLSFPFHKFGIQWLLTILERVHNRVNNESKWFPRTVMCDFMVRRLGSNQHWISTQCNLPINLFNELIFLILWAWFIFLTSLTCLSFILYLIFMYSNVSHRFISKYLHMRLSGLEKEIEDDFIENYLKRDGILIIRIIAYNTNDIIMADLVSSIFKIYFNLKQKEKVINPYEQIELNGLYARIDSTSI